MVTRQLNDDSTMPDVIRAVNAVVFRDRAVQNGDKDFGDKIKWRYSIDDYLLDLLNTHATGKQATIGGILNVLNSGVVITGTVPLTAAGLGTLGSLAVTASASVGGNLAVTGNETIGGTLGVTGTSSLGNVTTTTITASGLVQCGAGLSVNAGVLNAGQTQVSAFSCTTLVAASPGTASIASTLNVGGLATLARLAVVSDTTLGTTLGVTGLSTLTGGATVGGTFRHTGTLFGAFNVAAVTRQTIGPSAGAVLAEVQSLANAMRGALIQLGLCQA